jgi:uncharacterized OB-fold protein
MAKTLQDTFTEQALKRFGHRGSQGYYQRLREERKLCTTQCKSCAHIAFPAREFCPACYHPEVDWISIGEGARLHAFTTQARALRFTAPAVIGIVEIPEVGFMLAPIGGRYDELQIGQPLTLKVIDLDGGLIVPSFVPTEADQ